ncbi:oligopeptide ABC transporter substrate-binding protein OppA [Paraphotobacterium marinum]|uniref:Oligopeptide ABC transporter substrate-binding protein OppA n=1 Tax=Paraphotobacterium marinum TaxID=1755811 RepID=A0A220VH66_9GAMM|nr:peptide ABC transporter substrate-binding protein [Paraphotobacterium marinum]ASK79522.1 oligopeptide ABC transporter substrate-binding protein OppA [Paraphotobacterium marinum]
MNKLIQHLFYWFFLFIFTSTSFAAEVPEGAKLAKNQQITFNNQAEPGSLDPTLIEDTYGARVAIDCFEGLITINDNGEPSEGVAKKWEMSKDGLTYTFYLRDDAKWSDGSPVTADNFVYSWQRAVDPQTASPYSFYLEVANIKNAKEIIDGKLKSTDLGVKAKDAHTLEVSLVKPTPYFVGMLGQTVMFPLPKQVIEKWGDKWTDPKNIVSNGAYKLTNHVINEKIVTEKNKFYWDNKNTIITKVTYLVINDRVADVNRYKSNGEDMTGWQLPGGDFFKSLQKEYGDQLKITPFLTSEYAIFNVKKPPFNDVDVRQAISLVIDKEALSKFVMGGATKPLYNFAVEGTANFKSIKSPYQSMNPEQRKEKALELLKKAGYSQDKPLKFSLLYPTSDERQKQMSAIAAMIQQALPMVQVTITNQEFKTYLNTLDTGNWEMARQGWVADFNDPMAFYGNLKTGGSQNSGGYSNKDFDQLIEKSFMEEDLTKRIVFFQKMQEILDKDYPAVTWFQTSATTIVKPYVKGFPMNDALNYIYSKNLYLIEY